MPKITRDTVTVPALDIDARMRREFGHKLDGRGRNERRITAFLCAALAESGWSPVKVYDGETETPATDTKAVMELVFNLDEAHVFFGKDGNEHWVFLVMGNDDDIISDWTFTEGDPDGFTAAMDDILKGLDE